ncbi:unnamed protein product, partial [Owenia fusiformis]
DTDAKVTQNTPNVLSCTERRTFWLSWENGLVQLGSGLVKGSSSMLIQWQDTDAMFRPRHMAVSTEQGTKGHWMFYNVEAAVDKFIQNEDQVDQVIETLTNLSRKSKEEPVSLLRFSNSRIDFDDDNVYFQATVQPLPIILEERRNKDYIVPSAQRLYGIIQDLVYSGQVDVQFKYGMRLGASEIRKVIPTDPNNFNDPYVRRFTKDASRVLFVDKWTVDTGLTIQKCAMRCLTETRIKCESFDYCSNVGECMLSDKHRADGENTGSYRNHSYCDHYSKSYIALNFEKAPGRVLTTFPGETKIYSGLSAESCAKVCIDETHFKCESFDYCPSSVSCTLNTRHKDSTNAVMVNRTDCSHYSKAFLGKFREDPASYLIGYEETVIHGIGKEACARTCLQETSFNCRSFNYCPTDDGKGTPSCLLNTHTKADVRGDKFVSDPNCSYSERVDAQSVAIRPKTLQYSSGQMAGLGIGMLLLGTLTGTGILFALVFFLRR